MLNQVSAAVATRPAKTALAAKDCRSVLRKVLTGQIELLEAIDLAIQKSTRMRVPGNRTREVLHPQKQLCPHCFCSRSKWDFGYLDSSVSAAHDSSTCVSKGQYNCWVLYQTVCITVVARHHSREEADMGHPKMPISLVDKPFHPHPNILKCLWCIVLVRVKVIPQKLDHK